MQGEGTNQAETEPTGEMELTQDADSEKAPTTPTAIIKENTNAEINVFKVKRKRRKKQKKNSEVAPGDNNVGGFTILRDFAGEGKKQVERVLPEWLEKPHVIQGNLRDESIHCREIGLDAVLVKTLQKNLIEHLFPVQRHFIPWILELYNPKLYRPSDVCVSAPTGSGKTLAYVLPLVHILKNYLSSSLKAIVVLPTEVLATQVYSIFIEYTKATRLKTFLSTKRSTLLSEKSQLIKKDSQGNSSVAYDILVATPGRLVDHLCASDDLDVSQLKFLVIDEADRTLDEQEGEWLFRLEAKFWASHPTDVVQPWRSLPLTLKHQHLHDKAFHKLLFSATLSQNPECLEKLHLFHPKMFYCSVGAKRSEGLRLNETGHSEVLNKMKDEGQSTSVKKYRVPEELKESIVICNIETKPLVLTYLIKKFNWKNILCFVNTKKNTHRLCVLLKHMGILRVKEVSSKWSPAARDLVLKRFSSGQIDMLVTSDQMARGIDIPSVDYVVSYDLPGYTSSYIHRIGRCARAGRKGQAVSLVTRDQINVFKRIMKSSGKKVTDKINIKRSNLKEMEPAFKEALEKCKIEIEAEDEKKVKKPVTLKVS